MTPTVCSLAMHLFLLSISTLESSPRFRLPPDDQWVKFDKSMEATDSEGNKLELTGTLKISLVGTSIVDGVTCRWLEIVDETQRGASQQREIFKILIPEEKIDVEESPLIHVIRVWNRPYYKKRVILVDDLNGNWGKRLRETVPMLQGPFETTSEPKKEMVDSDLGQIELRVVQATKKVKETGGETSLMAYTIRLNEMIPFGIEGWECDFSHEGDREKATMKFRVVDFGSDIKSEMPDQK